MLATLGPTQCSCSPSSSSHHPVLSITATANENSRSNVSSTKDTQSCVTTTSLVNLALAFCSAVGQTLPVFSSSRSLFSSHFAVPHLRESVRLSSNNLILEQMSEHCPFNIVQFWSELEPQRLVSWRTIHSRRRPTNHSRVT